jgi:hypothetical protein
MKGDLKPFNVKKELFTEFTDKNKYLLELNKRERKILIEKNLKKAAKKINFRFNSINKTFKSKNESNISNNFPSKPKIMFKSGGVI